MSVRPVLVDSNVLIHLTNSSSPDYETANAALRFLVSGRADLFYTLQNLAEFWNVCTKTGPGGLGLSIEETTRRLSVVEKHLDFLPEPLPASAIFKELLIRHRVSGVQVHDTRLAAIMIANEISEILTFEKAISNGLQN